MMFKAQRHQALTLFGVQLDNAFTQSVKIRKRLCFAHGLKSQPALRFGDAVYLFITT